MNKSVTPNLLRNPSGDVIHLPPNGRLDYQDGWIEAARADRLFEAWTSALDWRQRPILLFGREVMQPRLTCFYGEPGIAYRYSGKTLEARHWDGELRALAAELRHKLDVNFNSVLCNLYRDGQDSMGWHADNEAALGSNPVIASVSLGAARRFRLKPRGQGEVRSLTLGHGSLLVMSGDLQHHWVHELPKSKRVDGPRINLTFRRIR